MTFHVRIAISGVHKEPARSFVAIGDTVLVSKAGNQVLTQGIQKKYAEISYSLEESEPEVEEKKPKQASANKKTSPKPASGQSPSRNQDSGKQKTKGGSSEEEFDDESGEDEDEASEGSMEVMAAG